MRIALAQIFQTNVVKKNVSRIVRAIDLAARYQVKLVIFPECAVTGYLWDYSNVEWSNVYAGLQKIKDCALSHHIEVVIGCPLLDRGELFNCALHFDSKGGQDSYQKINLTEFEVEVFRPGSTPKQIRINSEKVGVLVCRDQNSQELAKCYKDSGASALIICSAHYYPPDEAVLKRFKNISIPIQLSRELNLDVYKVNAVGKLGQYLSFGHSLIVHQGSLASLSSQDKEELTIYDRNDHLLASTIYLSEPID